MLGIWNTGFVTFSTQSKYSITNLFFPMFEETTIQVIKSYKVVKFLPLRRGEAEKRKLRKMATSTRHKDMKVHQFSRYKASRSVSKWVSSGGLSERSARLSIGLLSAWREAAGRGLYWQWGGDTSEDTTSTQWRHNNQTLRTSAVARDRDNIVNTSSLGGCDGLMWKNRMAIE